MRRGGPILLKNGDKSIKVMMRCIFLTAFISDLSWRLNILGVPPDEASTHRPQSLTQISVAQAGVILKDSENKVS